jgi:hypothetical protein
MDEEERQHQSELLQAYKRRLHVLEQQAAEFGAQVSPQVVIEMEDLRAKIADINTKLNALPPKSQLLRYRSPVPHCPYPGLSPYNAENADVFFGRQGEIDTALAHLTYHL